MSRSKIASILVVGIGISCGIILIAASFGLGVFVGKQSEAEHEQASEITPVSNEQQISLINQRPTDYKPQFSIPWARLREQLKTDTRGFLTFEQNRVSDFHIASSKDKSLILTIGSQHNMTTKVSLAIFRTELSTSLRQQRAVDLISHIEHALTGTASSTTASDFVLQSLPYLSDDSSEARLITPEISLSVEGNKELGMLYVRFTPPESSAE